MFSFLSRHRRTLCYAACAWALLFAAPHTWWAMGIPAGFPGGIATYERWMSSGWRSAYNVSVILLSMLAAMSALMLRNTPGGQRERTTRAVSLIAGAVLALRGVAGLFADGMSDLVWWPAFLIGGILFVALGLSVHLTNPSPTQD